MTLLNIANVSFQFAGANKTVLQNINYQVNAGDFIILLGSNGSGKSTLLKLLRRYYQPQVGQIYLTGKPLQNHDQRTFYQKIKLLNQNCDESLFTTLTVYEHYLLLSGRLLSRETNAREFFQNYLSSFNANLPQKLDCITADLSGGEKQALVLALALLQPPALLLLDEHTSALDPKAAEQIMKLTAQKIQAHRMTCILTTHDLDIAIDYGNRILVLQDGKLLSTFDAEHKKLVSKEQLFASYF